MGSRLLFCLFLHLLACSPYLWARCSELSKKASSLQRATVHPETARGSSHASQHCKRLLWFMGLKADPESDYFRYIKAALLSAKHRAPSLMPILVYSGPACAMTAWFELHGGTVIFHDLSFFSDLRDDIMQVDDSGAYLRLDIPALMPSLSLPGDINTQLALYTDIDVMFLKDITSCSIERPALLALGAEAQKGTKSNTGVMLLNIEAFEPHVPEIVKFAKQSNWDFISYDQGLLLSYFPQQNISQLPDTFNWKGYWGSPEYGDAFIFHWHGPKPLRGLPCLLRRMIYKNSMSPADMAEVCKVPEIYAKLVLGSPDNGTYYNEALQLYEKLLQNSPQDPI